MYLYKSEPLRSRALREGARGQDCTLRLPGCSHDPAETVLCHLPYSGGGERLKASDDMAVHACKKCHDKLDGRVPPWEPPVDGWDAVRALAETREVQRRLGLVTYK